MNMHDIHASANIKGVLKKSSVILINNRVVSQNKEIDTLP